MFELGLGEDSVGSIPLWDSLFRDSSGHDEKEDIPNFLQPS